MIRDKEGAPTPSKAVRQWTLFAAILAGEACSICATCFTNALRPPRLCLIDRFTQRPLPRGQIGALLEVFYWNDLIRVVLLSLVTFIVVWCAIRTAA